MKNSLLCFLRCAGLPLLLLFFFQKIAAQSQAPDAFCTSASTSIRPSAAIITYGTGNKMKNSTRRMRVTIGQPLVGTMTSDKYDNNFGIWTSFLVPPLPPSVKATQGELLDRIQLSWSANPLGAFPIGGFKIYRDSIFIAQVDKNTRNYNDFNVIAGKNYVYEVRGINAFGEGSAGAALGFQVPNGVVTGWVRTLNGNAVPGAQVMLSPMQGYSARFGQFDGATATATSATNGHFFPTTAAVDWSLTFWTKTTFTNGTAFMMQVPHHLNVIPTANGISIEVGGTTLSGNFPNGTANQWHNVALTYGSGQYRLYLDGVLVSLQAGSHISESSELNFGTRTNGSGNWDGYLDELRIYHRRLDESDLVEVLNGTASSLTPQLHYYWKFDEGAGTKSFDLIRRSILSFCGAIFNIDRPNVPTSGVTNADGYYRIESANYGTGTTFLATPKKDFYKHRALKFISAESDFAQIPDFRMPDQATLEVWLNQSEPQGTQTILYKKWGPNTFALQIVAGTVRVTLNGDAQDYGTLGIGYRHLAITIAQNLNNTQISVYNNGTLTGSKAYPATSGNWSDPGQRWILGAASPTTNNYSNFFSGLIDEIAVYDTTLLATTILQHALNERNPQEAGLYVYYALNEGTGNKLTNAGAHLIEDNGSVHGAEWTVLAKFQVTTPHIFTPNTRQVTLNPSVTSVDQVDFVDRSTVAVTGFVRYKNTDCFAREVEILVNGESYKPIVLTDSTGKFTIDLEPGATVTLRPKYKNHEFFPEEINLSNVISPVAGIVFNDITTRTISGKVAGGKCKKSIISNPNSPTGTVCRLLVRTTNGCFEKSLTIDNSEGDYTIENLPPLALTIAVTEHSDPRIKTAFQVQGGVQVDLSEKKDTTVHFIYFAPPQVEIAGLEPYSPSCQTIVLQQNEIKTINIKVKETYYNNEVCYLDTAAIRLLNGFEDSVKNLTLKSVAGINYKFKVGAPVASSPFLKTMQVVATNAAGNETSLTVQGLVTGIHKKHNTFTTQFPQAPTLILHDPPGDGSSAFFESEQTICQNLEFSLETNASLGLDLTFHLGAGKEVITAPLGIGTSFEFETKNTIGVNVEQAYKRVDENTLESCLTFSKKISTGDNSLIVGSDGGADVIVGTGLNLEFGFADFVDFDTLTCAGKLKTVISVEPDTFTTNFIYTEFSIQNTVIRYLDSLRLNDATTTADSLLYAQSIALWNNILDKNQKARDSMIVRENISFDAGVTYEYAFSSDTTKTNSALNGSNTALDAYYQHGFAFEKIGFEVKGSVKASVSYGKKSGSSDKTSIKTGFILKDDDPLDAFSVDVGIDPHFNTPIFRTRAGQSSCPWEPNTAHREVTTFQFRDGSGPVAVDVPSKEKAVFLLNLGNNSETNELWTYALSVRPESNPHGAIIKVNGEVLNGNLVNYTVPFGESVPITVTVERGPIEYDYENLEIAFHSACEYERATALGNDPRADQLVYKSLFLSAHFIRPCSEVDINVPEQNWVVFPGAVNGGNGILQITASGYDKTNTDFDKIRLQYRRSNGDGTWINITSPSTGGNPDQDNTGAIARDKLGNIFTQFFWNTQGLSDGNYDIRAVSICAGNAADLPGYSQIIKGSIQRQPPSLIGTPQPSDGVLHVGDEISFKFNKDINCQRVNALDNVLLFDATTGLPRNIHISCKDNQIIIDPRFDNNQFYENRIFRAELHNIEDLVGNIAQNPISQAFPSLVGWEFYVDRNELAWLTDSLGMTKFDDQTKSAVAKIHNRGGYPAPFEIREVPSWVRVVPNTGTLAPNEVLDIRFEVDSTLPFGHWFDTIVLRTLTGQNPFFMGGDEGLPFGCRVVCRPPDWSFDPKSFTNSMNLVLKLNVQGAFSLDVEDVVIAFLGNQVVGRAHVQYVPQTGDFLAFLTVYGEAAQQNQPLRLEIWDASACLRFGILQQNFTFQPDNVIGSPTAPQIIETSNFVLRDVPIGTGWNWLSFNLAFQNPSLNSALTTLRHPANDLIKSQTQFSTYSGNTWVGSLTSLENPKMYIFKADQPDTLRMEGSVLNPANSPISVVQGWNWIGYIPKFPLPVNQALASLNPTAGDLIKSQTEFAQFINPTFGWVGNLKFMQAPQGYQLKLANGGTLTYPSFNLNPNPNERGLRDEAFWTVDAAKFEHSTTLIGYLNVGGTNATTASMEIGAFVGSEIRGAAQAIFIEATGEYLFFLTIYANSVGENLTFKLFDAASGTVLNLAQTQTFTPHLHQGSILAPVPFSPKSTAAEEVFLTQSFDIQPNPMQSETVFKFALTHPQEVVISIVDVAGRTVSHQKFDADTGVNSMTWRAQNHPSGMYWVRLETNSGAFTRRLILQK